VEKDARHGGLQDRGIGDDHEPALGVGVAPEDDRCGEQRRDEDYRGAGDDGEGLASFDWKIQPSNDPKVIKELTSGRFISDGEKVLLLGPPGLTTCYVNSICG